MPAQSIGCGRSSRSSPKWMLTLVLQLQVCWHPDKERSRGASNHPDATGNPDATPPQLVAFAGCNPECNPESQDATPAFLPHSSAVRPAAQPPTDRLQSIKPARLCLDVSSRAARFIDSTALISDHCTLPLQVRLSMQTKYSIFGCLQYIAFETNMGLN
jgi:hypothetical protein